MLWLIMLRIYPMHCRVHRYFHRSTAIFSYLSPPAVFRCIGTEMAKLIIKSGSFSAHQLNRFELFSCKLQYEQLRDILFSNFTRWSKTRILKGLLSYVCFLHVLQLLSLPRMQPGNRSRICFSNSDGCIQLFSSPLAPSAGVGLVSASISVTITVLLSTLATSCGSVRAYQLHTIFQAVNNLRPISYIHE